MSKGHEQYQRACEHLCHCRLEESKKAFKIAGKLFGQEARADKKNSSINKLNSAICFHLAGSYADTLAILDTIQESRLKPELVVVLNNLYVEAKKKRKSSYLQGIAVDYYEMKQRGMHKDILLLLKENPYLFEDKNFALQGRDSCLALGMVEVAASFEHDYNSLPN